MTCVVGIADGTKVWLGADSCAANDMKSFERADRKLFKLRKDFLIGYTTSFRMGQILEYRFQPPLHDQTRKDFEYLATVFIDEVRKCLSTYGWSWKKDEHEIGGNFLIGYRGEIYEVEADFHIASYPTRLAAVGAGESFALGALDAIERHRFKLTPVQRIRTALQAAARYSPWVRPPFHILSL